MRFRLKVNGETRQVEAEPGTPLLWVLRDELRLTGTKFGCGIAQCGACTVHLDAKPARACVVAIESVGSRAVTTIEGLTGPTAAAVQKAWESLQVPQCGYCQSGQVMTTVALLAAKPKPSDEDVDHALAGNLCRCATYDRIRAAVHQAAAELGG